MSVAIFAIKPLDIAGFVLPIIAGVMIIGFLLACVMGLVSAIIEDPWGFLALFGIVAVIGGLIAWQLA